MPASQELQDELVSIDAIYPGCMVAENGGDEVPLKYLLYPPSYPGLCVGIEFGPLYPEESEPPRIFTARGPGADQDLLQDILNSVFVPDQVCVFDFIEALNDLQVVDEHDDEHEGVASGSINDEEYSYQSDHDDDAVHSNQAEPLEGWICSEPIIDRKSVFIGRAIPITSLDQINQKIAQLKGDKKIAKAAHNMVAYRFVSPSGNMIQDCDDDGETAAGSRMLHLLTLMDCKNILVVVTRWYGGTKLGSDRFRHINNAARLALVKGNYIPEKQESSGKRGSKKGKKK